VLSVFDFLQLIVYPLAPATPFPWDNTQVMAGLYYVLLPLTPEPGTDYPTGGVFDFPWGSVFIACAAYVVLVAGLLLWCIYSYGGASTYRPRWRVKLLRWLVVGGALGFQQVVTTNLLGVFQCAGASASSNTPWLDTEIMCYQVCRASLRRDCCVARGDRTAACAVRPSRAAAALSAPYNRPRFRRDPTTATSSARPSSRPSTSPCRSSSR
jgi:hypothetical protein